METILTIAGSDPSAEAGIQVDLQVFHSLKMQGITAITAVTAQNDERFFSVNPVPSTLLREQLRSVVGRYRPKTVKIGMLGTEENVLSVYRFLQSERFEMVLLDPVLKSSTGAILLEPKGIAVMKQLLVPIVNLVTPNLDEAETLTGLKVRTVDQMKEAALNFFTACRGVKGVLIKGGHLEEEATDVLYDGREWHLYSSKIRFAKKIHGTGCVYSAALAAYMARGEHLAHGVKLAKEYVTHWIRKRNQEWEDLSNEPDKKQLAGVGSR